MALVGVLANDYLNAPVGPAVEIQGTVNGNCVPRGRESSVFDCSVTLSDGSYDMFRTATQLTTGSKITYSRRNRRFFGRAYERR